jgi:hypothetical protein
MPQGNGIRSFGRPIERNIRTCGKNRRGCGRCMYSRSLRRFDPLQMRMQAGENLVLFGGVSPEKRLPQTREKEFIAHVREWPDLRKTSPRSVQSAGDQVPPGTERKRIKLPCGGIRRIPGRPSPYRRIKLDYSCRT